MILTALIIAYTRRESKVEPAVFSFLFLIKRVRTNNRSYLFQTRCAFERPNISANLFYVKCDVSVVVMTGVGGSSASPFS